MCWSKIVSFFQGDKSTIPLVLPYPEEEVNPTQTMDNTDIDLSLRIGLFERSVPQEFWDYWLSIDIRLSLEYPYPAVTWADVPLILIRPEWVNPGVLFHELCHIVQKGIDLTAFKVAYDKCSEPLLILVKDVLLTKDPVWASSILEIHSEVYRYLGDKMPGALKKFYPKLF